MRLKDHIAHKFLTDEGFWFDIIEKFHKGFFKLALETEDLDTLPDDLWLPAKDMYTVLRSEGNKSYYITETVMKHMNTLLKVRKRFVDGVLRYDWRVFGKVAEQKVTFIFPDNTLLRVLINEDVVHFTYMYRRIERTPGFREEFISWTMFYVNRTTGEQFGFVDSEAMLKAEKLAYHILCFMYLTKNDEVLLQHGQKTGTVKSGKVINDLPFKLTVVNSRWHTTTIRTEGFGVSAHFALRWYSLSPTRRRATFVRQEP